MTTRILVLTILLASLLPAIPAQARDVQVMVLGTYHLANPGRDLHNVEVDDVTSEPRQRQLEAVADVLAVFGPDRVAVEALSDRDDLSLASYEQFKPADLSEVRNETVQIGFRLAHRLGHQRVFGIDEQDENTDYYPFGRVSDFAQANDQSEPIEALHRLGASYVETVGRLHAEGHIGGALHWMNQPTMIDRMQSLAYYELLGVGDREEQPGALLNARYYERNARIFAKLMQVVEPGDRVLVVYGGGHSYWLRHFVSMTPGFELVEANDYLSALAAQ
ncbi:MAG: DUF5694 domain-containing protein [Wenzhouxiangella sp.]|jgi:hypothetical protein|nr:DUF5694 domain-containing protein [Wenzhouxiangella sp.]